MDILHEEEKRAQVIAEHQAKKEKRVRQGKMLLWGITIWDVVFVILQCFALQDFFPSGMKPFVFVLAICLEGAVTVALDVATLRGCSWTRIARAVFALITVVFEIKSFFGYIVYNNLIMILFFIGEFVICLFLFGSRSIQKYIDVKRGNC